MNKDYYKKHYETITEKLYSKKHLSVTVASGAGDYLFAFLVVIGTAPAADVDEMTDDSEWRRQCRFVLVLENDSNPIEMPRIHVLLLNLVHHFAACNSNSVSVSQNILSAPTYC